MKRLARVALAAAVIAVPGVALLTIHPETADADILRTCAKNSGGPLTALAGQQKCRKDEKERKLEHLMGNATDGEAEVTNYDEGFCNELASLRGGDIALCVGVDEHVGDPDEPNDSYGRHCFLWLETVVPLQRVTNTYEIIRPRLGCDEVKGNCLGDPDISRFIIAFVNGGEVSGGNYGGSTMFIDKNARIVEVEDALLLWPGDEHCRAVARISDRQR